MSDRPYKAPEYRTTAFNCPHCHAFSNMSWGDGRALINGVGTIAVRPVEFSRCSHCQMWSIWYEEAMIFPKEISVDDPSADLPEAVKHDYLEAAAILQDSPRGAGALLRLAIQKLVDSLVEGDDDLNKKIGTLVSQGLDQKLQQALDIVRVIGNEAVHPGQIDLNDSPHIVQQLFKMVNLIAQKMITEPREVEEMYSLLPDNKKEGIEARDKKSA
jgi:hypothetical protein